jgi:hypothetical protein
MAETIIQMYTSKSAAIIAEGLFATMTSGTELQCEHELKTANIVRRYVYTNEPHASQQQTPWPLVRERTIPTDRPPLVDEI